MPERCGSLHDHKDGEVTRRVPWALNFIIPPETYEGHRREFEDLAASRWVGDVERSGLNHPDPKPTIYYRENQRFRLIDVTVVGLVDVPAEEPTCK